MELSSLVTEVGEQSFFSLTQKTETIFYYTLNLPPPKQNIELLWKFWNFSSHRSLHIHLSVLNDSIIE